jgi:uncharacterized protein YjbJ (UPF0337 family)
MGNQDKLENAADEKVGEAKEALGKASGDDDLEGEGKVDQTECGEVEGPGSPGPSSCPRRLLPAEPERAGGRRRPLVERPGEAARVGVAEPAGDLGH